MFTVKREKIETIAFYTISILVIVISIHFLAKGQQDFIDKCQAKGYSLEYCLKKLGD